MNNTVKLIISLAIPLAIGTVSGLLTTAEIGGWFSTIQKPGWNPPNWLFGPVWSTLYVLMGIALFLVWKSNANEQVKRSACIVFAIQLVFNFLWSIIFFNQHQIGLAVVDIILLWISIFICIIQFSNISKVAAWLLVPYISWVSFAGILNYTIYKLNS